MYGVSAWSILALAAVSLFGCADAAGPTPQSIGDPTVADATGRLPKGPLPVPDSVGIPPSIPPIYEEVPTIGDAPQ